MKTRRHHNNKGERTVRSGKTYEQVQRMAARLKKQAKCAHNLVPGVRWCGRCGWRML
jgi:hypothetical protein